MLIVSTYPLIRKPEQFYNAGGPPSFEARQFSSTTEEGEYWATLHLLAAMNAPTKLREPQSNFPWLAVMGRDGIWPIQEPERPTILASPQPKPTQSVGWKLFFSLSSMFCVIFAGVAIYFNSKTSHTDKASETEETEPAAEVAGEHVPLGWLAA
jgi:hypothetical protein